MKKLLILFLGLIISMVMQAAPRTHSLKVGLFSSLDVVNDIAVTCRAVPDSLGYVSFTCEDDMASALIFENKGSKLKIMSSPDVVNMQHLLPEVIVYTESLDHVQSSSSKPVRIEHLPVLPKLTATLIGNGYLDLGQVEVTRLVTTLATGNGTIAVSGKCEDALIKLTGTGSVQAQNLSAAKVTCHIFGGGEIYCWPLDQLVLKGLGSTRVYYRGNPKLKKSGFGKLIPFEESYIMQ